MPASRSVVSVLLRELGDFSLHPQGERYAPIGTPLYRIVTAEQARSAGCYDPSATLPPCVLALLLCSVGNAVARGTSPAAPTVL
jgi:hypothetical protein